MRWQLFALCVLAFFITATDVADWAGVGARPWYGWWDSNTYTSAPFTLGFSDPRPGGASAQAGITSDDRVDIRNQSLGARLALVFQMLADRPTTLTVERDGKTRAITVTGSSVWDGRVQFKIPTIISVNIAALCFIVCALLLVFRSRDAIAQTLILVLLCLAARQLEPTFMVVPWPALQIVMGVAARVIAIIAALLLIRLAWRTGEQTATRKMITNAAVCTVVLVCVVNIVAYVGLITLWFDPLPLINRVSRVAGWFDALFQIAVLAATLSAVLSTAATERARAAWLLLPIPTSLLMTAAVQASAFYFNSWTANVTVIAAGDVFLLIGASAVAYALLNRRVLDIEFVLGRTLVVGIVSAIIVGSFILLEFLLNTVLTGVSHMTGLVANAGLALALGFSINAIHTRVDAIVEGVLFRKRLEDERALRNYAKEAAFVTTRDALLEQTTDKLSRHTDARSVAILLDGTGSYGSVGENDPVVLALKAHHAPLDPHHFNSSIHGALALPMLARGRLLGIVVLGERSGGEAYAPDEIEALAQMAQGVGSALDALSSVTPTTTIEQSVRSEIAPLRDRIDAIARKLDA